MIERKETVRRERNGMSHSETVSAVRIETTVKENGQQSTTAQGGYEVADWRVKTGPGVTKTKPTK